MSKYVKNLIVADIQQRLRGVDDALVVNVVGLNSGQTYTLRKQLREKQIHVLVVKNSLAKRATEGTRLGPAFDHGEGTQAVCWGSEDFVSLVKEIIKIGKQPEYEKFSAKGGVLDGERLSAEKVEQISKWPNRLEQLSLLVGQILSPGSTLLSQLCGPGGALLSQIDQVGEGKGDTTGDATGDTTGDATAEGAASA